MTGYDRKIQYLDYYELGEKKFGAGFAKLENRGGLCSISIQISGLKRRDGFAVPLLLMTADGESELARLQFADGRARTCMEQLDAQDLDGKGLQYSELLGLRVPIAEEREIRALWGKLADAEPESAPPRVPDLVPEADEPIMEEAPPEPTVKQEPESQETNVRGDKWEQLFSIYPHVHPFEDDRVYLSIGPGDFVLLSAKSYSLVNNSFLLHGFYSYQHLILARARIRGEIRYYIGVPGSFHERERRIAVMFGFESFECSREPAQEGDFGYYMIAVEL